MHSEAQVASALDSLLEQVLAGLTHQPSVFFLRAQPLLQLRNTKIRKLDCHQSFKPWADRLVSAGFVCSLDWPTSPYDLTLYLPTRFKQENLYNFSRLAELLEPDGILLCAAHNKLGARSYENSLGELFGDLESFSLNHCRISVVKNGKNVNGQLLQEWKSLGLPKLVRGTQLYSSHACFSSQEVDKASSFLSEFLPKEFAPRGADLGAGYGYLSDYVLGHGHGIEQIHLYEAENDALICAQENLRPYSSRVDIRFHWHDVGNGLLQQDLDWVIMNPPLHDLSRAQSSLAAKFVQAAHAALRRDGMLYLVFNAHLPYPKIISELFRSYKVLGENKSFKVMAAKK